MQVFIWPSQNLSIGLLFVKENGVFLLFQNHFPGSLIFLERFKFLSFLFLLFFHMFLFLKGEQIYSVSQTPSIWPHH